MQPVTATVFILAALVLAAHTQASELIKAPAAPAPEQSGETDEYHPSQIIVQYKAATKSAAPAAPKVVRLKAGTNVLAAVRAYRNRPDVLHAQPDYILKSDAVTPNDPQYAANLWHLPQIKAPQAWSTTTGSSAITVCIADTGVDFTHPDIQPNMHPELGRNVLNASAPPMDDRWHGTHLAGIIGAVGNNGRDVTGVAWRVRILACKFIDSSGNGLTSKAAECINYCWQKGAKIINASFGGGSATNTVLSGAIKAAGDSGALFVNSAGNTATDLDSQPRYPASWKMAHQITVASTGRNDAFTSYSNYGAGTVHLAAPGEAILSTVPKIKSSSGLFTASGTSMATPIVSGAAALAQAAAGGQLTALELKDLILRSVDQVAGLDGKVSTKGRINMEKLVAAAKAAKAAKKKKSRARAKKTKKNSAQTKKIGAPASRKLLDA